MISYRVTLLTALLVTASASGEMLTVQNAGFEDLVLANGSFQASIPGWTGSGDSGTFNPTSSQYAGEAPEGENVAYSATGGPTISQVLADTLATNMTYTLMVEVGDRMDLNFPGYNIQLLAGGTLIAEDNNSMSAINGEFFTSTVVYESTDLDALAGQPLEIRMRGFGPQVNFDDVRLMAVPEPSMALMMMLLACFTAVCRR